MEALLAPLDSALAAATAAAAPADLGLSDLWSMGVTPLDKTVRTIAVYLGIVLLIRFAGKRLMAQMNSLDLVVVLLLSNVVQNAIIGNDNSLTGGMLGAVVLIAANAGIERLTHRYPALHRLLEGRPTQVVRDGVIDTGELARLGLTRAELHWALRHQGADDVSEVAKATLDPGGSLAVDLRPRDQAVSQGDLDDAMTQLRAYLEQRLGPAGDRPAGDRPAGDRPAGDRPATGGQGRP